jgi:formamidopyrimidine-DNA glycosylase
MLEIPEARVLAQQIMGTIKGKKILRAAAAQTPHKFAWFAGNPESYSGLLVGKTIDAAAGFGGLVEIRADDTTLTFGDGVTLKYHEQSEPRPPKHQLLIEFVDGTALSGTVQMYGGLWCYQSGTFQNPYHQLAKEKPSPLSIGFNESYFEQMITAPEVQKFSLKAFLATEQRIPGLGNGVLQDILFNAGMHPRKKVNTLSPAERRVLLEALKSTLAEMVKGGGRDTEKDLFGELGGYVTKVSKNTVDNPCRVCGTTIRKEAYLGGSIYFCEKCQKV